MSFKGKKNAYFCKKCGRGFVTLDVDEGTTPFMMLCVDDQCKGEAFSTFYRLDPMLKDVPHSIEWYMPSPLDLVGQKIHVIEHVSRGGLLPRKVERG